MSCAAFFQTCFPVPYHYTFLGFSVTGTPPLAAAITETANATVTLVTRDEIGIDIEHEYVDNDLTAGHSAGDLVDCTIRISNEGTTTLSTFSIGSSLLDGQRARYEYSCCACAPHCYRFFFRRRSKGGYDLGVTVQWPLRVHVESSSRSMLFCTLGGGCGCSVERRV